MIRFLTYQSLRGFVSELVTKLSLPCSLPGLPERSLTKHLLAEQVMLLNQPAVHNDFTSLSSSTKSVKSVTWRYGSLHFWSFLWELFTQWHFFFILKFDHPLLCFGKHIQLQNCLHYLYNTKLVNSRNPQCYTIYWRPNSALVKDTINNGWHCLYIYMYTHRCKYVMTITKIPKTQTNSTKEFKNKQNKQALM